MGRPIDKYFLGATGGSPATIPVRGDVDGTDFEGFIVSQKGSTTFRISNDAGSKVGEAILVNKLTGFAQGECAIVGIVDGGDAVAIQKITAHKAVGFNGTVYSWATADDSAESLLRLTAI